MATWHQSKAGLGGLYQPDANSWKVISDNPGEFASAILKRTKREAEKLSRRNGGKLIPPTRYKPKGV
jgi:hypothetical protein